MSTYNYGKYASTDDDYSGSSGSSGSSDSGNNSKKIIMTPYATVRGKLDTVFTNQNNIGQSLAIVWDELTLRDGTLYYDPDKDNYKVFSWKEAIGIGPDEDDSIEADDANKYLMKTYGSTEKRYDLVDAVVPGKDDPVEIGDAIMWYGGSTEYGPKSASVTLAKLLTRRGNDMVPSKDDNQNWLAEVTRDNLLRPDLQDREVDFFEVKRDSNKSDRKFNHPIMIDVATETRVKMKFEDGPEGDEAAEAAPSAAPAEREGDDTFDAPEPVADFLRTCESIGYTDPERAATLLDDLVADEGNDLTADMIEEVGGRDEILAQVGN